MRLFVDRDLGLQFGRAIRDIGQDVQLHSERYPGRGDVPDEEWITDVTRDGYVIFTHDARIRSRPTERTAFEVAGARVFVFATKRPTPFVHLRALMIAWERVEDEVATTPPPFMFGIDADGVMNQYVPYDPAARPTSGIHRARRRSDRQSRLDI